MMTLPWIWPFEPIARFSREDVRERVLVQEILLGLDGLVELEPELLRGFLTLRVGYLILLLTAEVAAEFRLAQDEAYEKLMGFSPSEITSSSRIMPKPELLKQTGSTQPQGGH